MGHISDLPRDVLWLILRHAIYAEYFYYRDLMNEKHNYVISMRRDRQKYLIHIVNRYARVSRHWLFVMRSKMQTRPDRDGWSFITGAWSDFAL
jgi:hypothetical protein